MIFLTFGIGDCFHSYTPNAVKKIGLWDERFLQYYQVIKKLIIFKSTDLSWF